VRLLLKLGYALEEWQGTVYVWPDEMQKKDELQLPLVLCLMSGQALVKSGKDIGRLSVATALRIVRKAMRAPHRRSGSSGLGRQLAQAVKDSYKRKTSKRARAWAHKKNPKPIGDPKARAHRRRITSAVGA
jgi:hypothetical protein